MHLKRNKNKDLKIQNKKIRWFYSINQSKWINTCKIHIYLHNLQFLESSHKGHQWKPFHLQLYTKLRVSGYQKPMASTELEEEKKNEGDYFTSARSFPLITEKFQIKQTFTKIEKNNNSIQLTSTPQESIHLNLTYFCLHDLHICLIIPRFYIKEYWRLGNRTRLLWFFIRISLKTFLPYAGSFCTLL